jgi:hypothetical protein
MATVTRRGDGEARGGSLSGSRIFVSALVAAVVCGVAGGSYYLGTQHAPAHARPGSARSTATQVVLGAPFYLDIGASASRGTQPTGFVQHKTVYSNTGYANDLVIMEKSAGVLTRWCLTGHCMTQPWLKALFRL